MPKRHPSNRNLHLHAFDSFGGMPVQTMFLPMVTEYLGALHTTLVNAVCDYPRVLAVRFDPVIPTAISDRMTAEDHKKLIKRFIASLKATIEHDRERKCQAGWAPDTKVRYVWCREVGTNGKPHYHFLLILRRDVYHMLGKACSPNENLFNRISRSWHSALGLEWSREQPLIYVSSHPVYWIDRGNDEQFNEAFHRASYMCKADTKQYGNGMRAFGTSRS
ncbi:MAG: inovirus Gp2 family protein [Marinobacter sp.]|uniref:inovirus Gp2 family protein n=1 Tax=Marinobacter sp. TaxID=50741 RepID=UPI003F9641EA